MGGIEIRESDIVAGILDYLAWKRIFHYRNNVGGMTAESHGRKRYVKFGVAGAPDIIAVIEGVYVGIECKTSKGTQSTYQREFRNGLTNTGKGVYLLIKSVDQGIEAIEDTVSRLHNLKR